jgi:hypothetical protein
MLRKKEEIPATKWLVSCTAAMLTCLLGIPAFYYTYTGALGFESLVLDIISLLIFIAIGQFFSIHIYKRISAEKSSLYISISILVLLAAAFTVFTFAAPHIPLFKDPPTGKYGI